MIELDEIERREQERHVSRKATVALVSGILACLFVLLPLADFISRIFTLHLLVKLGLGGMIYHPKLLAFPPAIFAIIAVVLGHLTRRAMGLRKGVSGGKGRVTAGLVLGYVVLALAVGYVLVIL